MRSRYLVSLAAVVALTLAAGCSPSPQSAADTADSQPSVGSRMTVISADILVLDGKHIRLGNAFAPETIPDARCWAEAVAARQATGVVQRLINNARTVTVEPTGGQDEYNRAFSIVILDGLDLGQVLIDNGLAARRTAERFNWCDPISRSAPGAPAITALTTPPRL
ncbi:thermonuclease family protein [Caulobacter sp. NIBR2454]|uniref:thermonuclease family protein n=1 Tax=Caulobacter sp. NIBR2454 TaxID=3015996 RepID=UPI0022B600E8|nr:nuclease [Caulobacter sp. NIBR2454]